jgi:hypothetical protein
MSQGIHSRPRAAVGSRPYERIGQSPAERLLLDELADFVKQSREWREGLLAGTIATSTPGPRDASEDVEVHEAEAEAEGA